MCPIEFCAGLVVVGSPVFLVRCARRYCGHMWKREREATVTSADRSSACLVCLMKRDPPTVEAASAHVLSLLHIRLDVPQLANVHLFTHAQGIPSVILSSSNVSSRAERHRRGTRDLGRLSGDFSRGSNIGKPRMSLPFFDSSTSGSLKSSSKGWGFPTTMGTVRPGADRRATKRCTRILGPSTEIGDGLTRRAASTSNGREQSAFVWWNSLSTVYRNGSLEKSSRRRRQFESERRQIERQEQMEFLQHREQQLKQRCEKLRKQMEMQI